MQEERGVGINKEMTRNLRITKGADKKWLGMHEIQRKENNEK